MDRYFKIISDKLLAVEGKDEANFFDALLKYEQIRRVQIIDIGGRDKFPKELGALRIIEGFGDVTVIGFVRDAETEKAGSAFMSVCMALKKAKLPVPKTINVFATGPPKIGIFIMPDNQGAGMLESLCLKTLEGRKIETCIEQYIGCFAEDMAHSEKEKFILQKAKVQAYLASRSPITNSLGVGARNGYWDFSHSCFKEIKKFLHNLLEEV